MPWWMWLGAAGALLVIEMLTVDLLFASLAFQPCWRPVQMHLDLTL